MSATQEGELMDEVTDQRYAQCADVLDVRADGNHLPVRCGLPQHHLGDHAADAWTRPESRVSRSSTRLHLRWRQVPG